MKFKLLLSLLGLWLGVQLAGAQNTAFTYQGRLETTAGLPTGNHSFQFQLYSNATAGVAVSSPFNTNTWVSSGLFTVTLDFGIAPFNGRALWLQLWVAPSNSPPPVLTLLSPRQPITPTPYAIFANTASNAAANAVGNTALQMNSVTANKIASGQVVKSFNGLMDAVTLAAGANVTLTPSGNTLTIAATGGGGGWGLTGNAGTTPANNYFGASDNAQVRLHATGGLLVDNTTPGLSFGNQTRQMLNLWSTGYGIGVQSATLYQRSDQHFAWFRNGSHSDATFNPGAGGALLMYLDSGGNLYPNSSVVLDRTNVNNGALYPGLAFGSGSGEGIASKRTAGGNQYGLDFYTGFANRMTIRNDGAIGVGTLEPEYTLDVNGSAATRGSLLVNSKDQQDAAYPELPGIIFGSFSSSGEVISSQRGANGSNPNGLDFYTGFGRRLSIANGGNVGIGTATPQEKLEVAGKIKATSFCGSGVMPWQVVAGTTVQVEPNTGYLLNSGAQVTVTLPTSPNPGDVVRVSGIGACGWRIAQNAGQRVISPHFPDSIGVIWSPHETSRNWVCVASSADGTKLVAGAAAPPSFLYTSTDSGVTWTPRASSRNWGCVASSDDGTKLVAGDADGSGAGGRIYTSTDSGVTWTPRESDRFWISMASSADGKKLVAVENGGGSGGKIFTSGDSGVTWNSRESIRHWRDVASSSDGNKLVAVDNNGGGAGGRVYTSTDSGVSWTPRDSNRTWRSVASSSDGSKLVAAVGFGLIYTSTDSGLTWTPRASSQDWSSVASSVDGVKLVALVSSAGTTYTSTDAGVTWTAQAAAPLGSWSAVASSADGTKLVGVKAGGMIYTSGSRNSGTTSPGTGGYLVGAPYSTIELQYVGSGQFLPLSHEGSIIAY